MDDLDRRILDAVQRDAAQTMAELAVATGSTSATCHRRYRTLKQVGLICRIVALADEARSREPLTVLLGISVRDQSSGKQRSLRQFLRALPEVKMAWMTTGEFDYFLIGAFGDMASYLKFIETRLETHRDIVGYRSFVSMDEVKFDTGRSFSSDRS